MANNNTISTKSNFKSEPTVPTTQKLSGPEVNEITGFQNAPMKAVATFNDTNFIIDGTKGYTNTVVETGATRTISANGSGHNLGNVLQVRYQFDIDCTITLAGFDTLGNNTGKIDPIPAGTYDFWFASTPLGIILTIPLGKVTSIPILLSATVEDANPNNLILVFNEAVTATNIGYAFRVDAGARTLNAISGSGSTTLTFTIAGASILFGEVLDISYDSSTGDTIGVTTSLEVADYTQTEAINNVGNLVVISSATILESDKLELVVVFDDVVTIVDESGWTVNYKNPELAEQESVITGVTGSGTNTLTFTLTDLNFSTHDTTCDYDKATGNTAGLEDVVDQAVDNSNVILAVSNDFGGSEDTFNWDYKAEKSNYSIIQSGGLLTVIYDGVASQNQTIILKEDTIANNLDWSVAMKFSITVSTFTGNETPLKVSFTGPNFTYDLELLKSAGGSTAYAMVVRKDSSVIFNEQGTLTMTTKSWRFNKVSDVVTLEWYNSGWTVLETFDMVAEVGSGEFNSDPMQVRCRMEGTISEPATFIITNLYAIDDNLTTEFPTLP